MKRFLSVICMALLAGGMIFTSCTKSWTVTVKANNDAWGTVTGGGTYVDGAEATLIATPNTGYKFVKWDNGETSQTLKVKVTANVTYTAEFAAVTPDPEPEPEPIPDPTPAPTPTPSGNGVSVNFKTNSWNANGVEGAYYTDYDVWNVYSYVQDGEYPVADVCVAASTPGTYSDATTDGQTYTNGVVNWIEYYESTTLTNQNGQPFGDWWAKSCNINVTAFDANALTMSTGVSAIMFNAKEAFVDGVGIAYANKTTMTVAMGNVELTPSSAKKFSAKKRSTKLAVK